PSSSRLAVRALPTRRSSDLVLFRNLLYFAQGRRQKNPNPRDMGLYHPVIIGGHIRLYPHFLKQGAIMILRSFHRLHFRLVENEADRKSTRLNSSHVSSSYAV